MEVKNLMEASTWSSALFFKSFLTLVSLVFSLGFLETSRAQILIPNKSISETKPEKELFGIKSESSPIDLSSMNFASFQKRIQILEQQQIRTGLAYMISSGLVLVGASIGYSKVASPIEKGVYSLSQSLSVAAFGYGYYQYKIGSSERNFYELLASTRGLSRTQKDDLVRNYLSLRKRQKETNKWIHFSTYTCLALLNLVQARQESNPEVKTSMYFLGGVSALAAFSIHF